MSNEEEVTSVNDDWRNDPTFAELLPLLVEGIPQKLAPTVDENGAPLPPKKYAYVPAGNGSWAKVMNVDPCGHQTMQQRVYV